MKLTWRLSCSPVVIYYPVLKPGVVYLAESGNKDKNSTINVCKEIGTAFNKDSCPSFNIKEVKIDTWEDGSTAIAIKSDQLANPEEFYKVGNYDVRTLAILLLNSKCDKGIITLEEDQELEVAYNNYNSKVTLVHKDMPSFRESYNELNRLYSCSYGKKTKKWIPGHAYLTEKENYIYLGDFECNLKLTVQTAYGHKRYTAEHIPSSDLAKNSNIVSLVIYELKDEKKISEVFNNRAFNSNDYWGIKILRKKCGAVDGGEVLVNDISGDDFFDKYSKTVLENTLKESLKTTEFQRPYYSSLSDALDTLTIHSPGKTSYVEVVSPEIKKLLEDAINVVIWDFLCNNPSTSISCTERSFTYQLLPQYLNNLHYDYLETSYVGLLKEILSVNDIEELIKKNLFNFGELNKTLVKMSTPSDEDFDNYLKLRSRKVSYSDIGVRSDDAFGSITKAFMYPVYVESPGGCYRVDDSRAKLSTLGGDEKNCEELVNVLKEMCKTAIENDGQSVSHFGIESHHMNKPGEYFIYITLSDVINFAKTENKLTVNLMNELMTSSFRNLFINHINPSTTELTK